MKSAKSPEYNAHGQHFSLAPTLLSTDSRGYLRSGRLEKGAEMPFEAKDEYVAYSKNEVFRGMHLQKGNVFKVYQLLQGSVDFFLICAHKGCDKFGQKFQLNIQDNAPLGLIVPPGVATGYRTLNPTLILTLMSEKYISDQEIQIHPNSVIKGGIASLKISEKDLNAPEWEIVAAAL